MSGANAFRGEAMLSIAGTPHILRPTFQALACAEEELGPLFTLVERASAGELRLTEMASLFWHCLVQPSDPHATISKDKVGETIAAQGLATCAVPLRSLLGQILKGVP